MNNIYHIKCATKEEFYLQLEKMIEEEDPVLTSCSIEWEPVVKHKIRIHTYDDYIVNITDEEHKALHDGEIDAADLLEAKIHNSDCVWRNGGTDYEDIL